MTEELVIQGAEIAPTTLFGTDNPAEVVQRAAVVAGTLADLVRRQNLIVRIGQSEHVRVEGWTLLGSMLGVFPVVEWTRPVMRDDQPVGWEARVEARTRSGEVVGAAEAECLIDERTWKGRDDYARRSMAQTRAVSKALRLPLGFVMQLAGFDPTPADEMPVIEHGSLSEGGSVATSRPGRTPVLAGTGEPDGEPEGSTRPPSERDPAAGTPFAYDPDEPYVPEPATDKQKKLLNVLVGRLREAQLVTNDQVWLLVGREPIVSDDGELHWSPLRDLLSKVEATALIEQLKQIETAGGAPAVASLADLEHRLFELKDTPEARELVEKKRGEPGYEGWLRKQISRLEDVAA